VVRTKPDRQLVMEAGFFRILRMRRRSGRICERAASRRPLGGGQRRRRRLRRKAKRPSSRYGLERSRKAVALAWTRTRTRVECLHIWKTTCCAARVVHMPPGLRSTMVAAIQGLALQQLCFFWRTAACACVVCVGHGSLSVSAVAMMVR
jgi:hypothetical protein